MDKNAIKKYAVWARRELISRVSQKALQYGISEETYGDANADTINGHLLTAAEKKQRQALIAKIKKDGYQQAMEEAAYTWFNRFCALRYMEVNGYLPTHVRVFSDEQNNFKPQIIAEAIHLELDGLDMEKVYALKEKNKTDELYKYLLITQCNALSAILPGMFQKIADYTELLFPDNLLREGSAIEQMIALIPEEDWTDQVQIIGWLYQYYNTELNEQVYDGNMSRNRITRELLPAATTIYTPDWAVHYMVENSLGRLWVEGHPNEEMKASWKYYLEEAEQEPEVQKQLETIRAEYAQLKPEDIRVIDPCMGSGHILVVMFDVLVQIYEAYGYSAREAASMIVEHNLYGLDIDERAAQLSYFAVMMKARQYDRRFFSRKVQPHVYAIVESNDIDAFTLEYFVNGDANLKKSMNILMNELRDAKEYGSILNVTMVDFPALYARLAEVEEDISMHRESALNTIKPLIQVSETLAQRYMVAVTNPPYLGSSRFSAKLNDYVVTNYADVKSDLSMVMYKHVLRDMCQKNGFVSFITTTSWMTLSSFEKLRNFVLANYDFESLVDFGTELFDGKVGHNPIVAWVNRRSHTNHVMTGIRLGDYCYSRRDEKETEFFNKKNYHYPKQSNFSKIPGSPVAYWVSEAFIRIFESKDKISNHAVVFEGLKTRDKERFLRFWFEVSSSKWVYYAKGGSFRRWYGNGEYVVNWGADGSEVRAFPKSSGANFKYYFKPAITYSALTSYKFSARYIDNQLFGGGGGGITSIDHLEYILAFTNSCVFHFLMNTISSTMNFEVGQIGAQPVLYENKKEADITAFVTNNICLSRTDWDSYETSWDFKRHPMLSCGKIADAYTVWKADCESRFLQLKANEEELNRIFIDIYGLQDELTPDVANKDVTVHRVFDSKDDVPESMKGSNYVRTMRDEVVSLISYAVGCMFGRYSLDVDGLTYAGGEWDGSKYQTFMPDKDNIIPICDDDYFDDDITGRFIKWVETVYGDDTLEENLKFIANALGGKGSAREVIRNYFISDFYADHLKTYQKRPIYWLFDSGKKGGFKALIYMHRYQPDTIARIRTDYVHEQQSRYRTAIADLQQRINGASTGDRVKLTKQLTKLEAQAEEIRTYEEKIHHLADQMIPIDLDDGVKVNYAKFADVLAKIK
jgi:hypothetical protein